MAILKDKKAFILPVVSGIFLVLSFPPFTFFPLAWIALVPLLIAVTDREVNRSFHPGFLTGIVYFLGTVYWVYHSMFVYGHIPAVASVVLLLLLCLYLSLYTGMFAVVFNLIYHKSRMPAVLIAPVLWVSLEYARTYLLTGFPWSLLGYSQYSFLHLIQVSDIAGVYGITFLVAAVNGLVFDFIQYKRSLQADRAIDRHLKSGTFILTLVLSAVLVYGTVQLKREDQTQMIKVSVLQGNIDQDKKWDRRHQREVIDTYKTLSLQVSLEKPDLIVWPESALPFIFDYDRDLTDELKDFQNQVNAHMLIGSVLIKGREKNRSLLSNSVILLSPGTDPIQRYDKIHLVPFGEYVPMGSLFPFIKKMVTAVGDFVKGEEITIMTAPFAKIGNLICYEIAFPGLVRKFIDNGANMIVTVTNDAWFGRTSAPYQHFSMAVFRAVENRVPVARSANTGISGFIDSRGRIISQSDIFVKDALTDKIAVGNQSSIYARYGDIFAYICLMLTSLMLLGIMSKSNKQQAANNK